MTGWRGRSRVWTVVLLVAGLLAAVVLTALTAESPEQSSPLDPDNPEPAGAQAVARVLEREGVEVDVVRGAEELASLQESGPLRDSLVVVTDPEQLGGNTTRDLLATGGDVLVVAPNPLLLDRLGFGGGAEPVAEEKSLEADCSTLSGLRVRAEQAVSYPSGDGCFPTSGGHLYAERHADGRSVAVFGAPHVLANETVTDSGHAAVALRLLGERDRLVWYVPDLTDVAAGEATSLGSLLPGWVRPAIFLAALAVIALMLARGRRLGRLLAEPLPVHVRAIETTTSRGRLYRSVGDRAHAADTLRRATRVRLTTRLHLPRAAAEDPTALVPAVAEASGRRPDDVRRLLAPGGHDAGTDDDLVGLAEDLDQLEREVRSR